MITTIHLAEMGHGSYQQQPAESKEALNSEELYSEEFEELDEETGIETTPESVDELRERLERMKKMMAERTRLSDRTRRKKNDPELIDGNFLSIMFGLALVVILGVSIYAFYNLFSAIWNKNAPQSHEDL